MARATHGRDLDYSRMTKLGVLAGAVLFLVGALAEYGIHATGSPTATLETALLAVELAGPLVAFGSVFVFAIALPLVE